jgi:hypothetical protein
MVSTNKKAHLSNQDRQGFSVPLPVATTMINPLALEVNDQFVCKLFCRIQNPGPNGKKN